LPGNLSSKQAAQIKYDFNNPLAFGVDGVNERLDCGNISCRSVRTEEGKLERDRIGLRNGRVHREGKERASDQHFTHPLSFLTKAHADRAS
jgi:hypothetical protein